MLDEFFLIIGISGVLIIALNFILEISNKLEKNHKIYAILNLYGSTALFLYALYGKVWLFVILNGFLIIIGILGIIKVFRK